MYTLHFWGTIAGAYLKGFYFADSLDDAKKIIAKTHGIDASSVEFSPELQEFELEYQGATVTYSLEYVSVIASDIGTIYEGNKFYQLPKGMRPKPNTGRHSVSYGTQAIVYVNEIPYLVVGTLD